jgi:hypothetical protein
VKEIGDICDMSESLVIINNFIHQIDDTWRESNEVGIGIGVPPIRCGGAIC